MLEERFAGRPRFTQRTEETTEGRCAVPLLPGYGVELLLEPRAILNTLVHYASSVLSWLYYPVIWEDENTQMSTFQQGWFLGGHSSLCTPILGIQFFVPSDVPRYRVTITTVLNCEHDWYSDVRVFLTMNISHSDVG